MEAVKMNASVYFVRYVNYSILEDLYVIWHNISLKDLLIWLRVNICMLAEGKIKKKFLEDKYNLKQGIKYLNYNYLVYVIQ